MRDEEDFDVIRTAAAEIARRQSVASMRALAWTPAPSGNRIFQLTKELMIVKEAKLKELIMQSARAELGGVLAYETAVACAVNEDLQEEWTHYLEQTRTHVTILCGTM